MWFYKRAVYHLFFCRTIIKMDIYRFLLLTRQERAEIVFATDYLARRVEPGSAMFLYQVGNFYVELHLNTATDTVERVIPFKSTDLLEAYLSEVSYAEIEYWL